VDSRLDEVVLPVAVENLWLAAAHSRLPNSQAYF
jgi:hypothetical protein